ncbi:MAG: hypothetical protein WDO56_15135 [Gammaproteobacteria bacterium]
MSWNRNRVLVYRQAPVPGARVEAAARPALAASPDRIRVGIWDLDVSAGALPTLLDRMDECQQRFSFSSVEAPFATGLALPGIGVVEDWLKYTGKSMNPEYAQLNVAARPIYEAAKPVLEKLPIEWLIVVVKSMIADTTDPKQRWYNLFSTSSNNVVLISTYEVREYAAQAKRSFEAAVFGVGLSALLSALAPAIQYQKKSTGSIFDFCENRADIVKSIREPRIDPENRARIPADLLAPVEKMLEVLKEYKGGAALRKTKGKLLAPKKARALAGRSAGTRAPAARKEPGLAKAIPKATAVGALKRPGSAANVFLSALESLDTTLLEMSASKTPKRGTHPKTSRRK